MVPSWLGTCDFLTVFFLLVGPHLGPILGMDCLQYIVINLYNIIQPPGLHAGLVRAHMHDAAHTSVCYYQCLYICMLLSMSEIDINPMRLRLTEIEIEIDMDMDIDIDTDIFDIDIDIDSRPRVLKLRPYCRKLRMRI